MPARAAAPPRGIPAHRAVGILPRLPEREVAHVLLVVLVGGAARSRTLAVKINMRKLAVAGECADIEIYAAIFALVGNALFNELRNKIDHLRDVIGGGRIDIGGKNVQLLQILKEGILIGTRKIGESDTRCICATDRLVVHVRQVHDVLHLHAVELDDAP